ncbi:Nitric oxide reductase [Anaerohalosphaera lusitana]|uniref:Nitric oxide reductase n=1 Tax=Anaerohalosphaera lusitana TaxID=1936003 RepID=A0A1U9NPQ6_9BACT|nr:FprA family A-type flavoprotein [Anaerohalosphaera lusitana]AQT69496.1 Nitric oxide reductase [Anaerohalosphaera lusitana]
MRKIADNIYSVGAIDWDRRLFDELIPLPDGTSYNSYLIKGQEKTVLIDTVDPEKTEILIDNLVSAGVTKIDYIVAHHGEQDHSGSINDVLLLYPDAKVVANEKCKKMLIDLLCLDESNFLTIKEGDTLSLGDRTLEFIDTPWVHWPETFSTYLQEDKILFPCDFFGSHLATSDIFVENESAIYGPAKRYYAEIMSPFRRQIRGNLKKLEKFNIEMIAPSHGPVYKNPKFIIDAYAKWASEDVKNYVMLPYVSMHDSTRKMVEYFSQSLMDRGVKVDVFNLTDVELGKLAMGLVDAATIVLASPTMLIGAHPSAGYAAFLVNALRPKTKFMSIIGSYGWGSKMVDQLTGMMSQVKAEIIEPVVTKGYPTEDDYAKLDELADAIVAKHKEASLM